MKKMLSSFAVVLLISANAFAQNIPTDPSVRIGTLSNGMKYYIKKKYVTRKESGFQIGHQRRIYS